jgi:transcriptional regulator with XRE-family HTH domain
LSHGQPGPARTHTHPAVGTLSGMAPANRAERTLPVELARFGSELRARRQELRLTLKQAAPGGDHTHLSRIERGLDWPSRDLVVHLEQVLQVPRGQYLKTFIEECEPRRHSTQAGYRRSGRPTASLATAETPLLLCDRDGQVIRRLVPPMLREYRADEARPYRMVAQAIRHVVDVDNRWMRTHYRWTIKATEADVTAFDFILTPPVGRTVDHLEVAILEGGELDRVERHGSSLFRYWLTLPQSLGAGDRWAIEVASGVYGLTYRPGVIENTVYEPVEQVEMAVSFLNQEPRTLWWFDALPHAATPGMPSDERTLRLEDGGAISHYLRPTPGYAHGVGWLW